MISSREFHEVIRSELSAILFLQNIGILNKTWVCPSRCGERYVRLKECDRTENRVNFKFKCSRCKRWKSLLSGSWPHGMRLSCVQVLDMIFTWSTEASTRMSIAREGRIIGEETMTDWTHYIREVCVSAMAETTAEMIGGVGETVEID